MEKNDNKLEWYDHPSQELVISPIFQKIKVLCEQTRELTDDLHDLFWIMFNVIWFREFCVWLSYLEYEIK